MKFFDQSFWSSALANAMGSILASIIATMVSYWISLPFRQWLNLNIPKIGNFLQNILSWWAWPYVRFTIFLISVTLLYAELPNNNLWYFLSLVTFFTFFRKENTIASLSSPSSSFFDDFQNHNNKINTNRWKIKTGNPSISALDMGTARLQLIASNPPTGTNTFLLANGIDIDSGVVECDFELSPNSVFNIVFFCDDISDNWHMARFESRQNDWDAFLIKEEGPGVNWRFNKKLGSRRNSLQKYRARVEFNSERARMFVNGDLIGEITNPKIFGGKIGMFNEVSDVIVGSFSISKT